MRLIPVLVTLFLAAQAVAQNSAPATGTSLKDVHWQLREVIKMQLPATHTAERNGQHFKKNYSISYEWSDEMQAYLIDLPEKRLDPETEQISAGSKYFILSSNVDAAKVRLIYSEDEKQVAILIPAKKGELFVYHPFTNELDEYPDQVILGWYDRVQDRTLGRALELFRQLFAKMEEGQE